MTILYYHVNVSSSLSFWFPSFSFSLLYSIATPHTEGPRQLQYLFMISLIYVASFQSACHFNKFNCIISSSNFNRMVWYISNCEFLISSPTIHSTPQFFLHNTPTLFTPNLFFEYMNHAYMENSTCKLISIRRCRYPIEPTLILMENSTLIEVGASEVGMEIFILR